MSGTFDAIADAAGLAVHQWESCRLTPLSDSERERLILCIAGRMRGLAADMKSEMDALRENERYNTHRLGWLIAGLAAYRDELRAARHYAVADRIRAALRAAEIPDDARGRPKGTG